ncbi:MAG: class I SAM-dependent methyltransferase [Pseudobdellovibrio sp.]
MNFLRLPDYLLTVLFEDDDIIAIDKPYGFNAHTNDSKIEHSEFIQDGLIEIFEKQLNKKLHIVHRLDQTTTGVMIFGKSVEAAKKYAEYFFNRQVKKTYWFITKNEFTKENFLIDQPIIHKAKELDAKTQLTLLNKTKDLSLWKANPFTGRNHQIRIHAKAANISILGDPKYGGAAFPFLCLHNYEIEFPNGIIINSRPPLYFENLNLLDDQVIAKIVFETDRRLRLFSESLNSNQSFRLVHNKNNSNEPGFTIDQFGQNIIVGWYKENWSESEVRKFSYYATILSKPVIVRLMFDKGKSVLDKNQFIFFPENSLEKPNDSKMPTHWVASESKTNYEIRTDSGQSVGLFLNQRLQRNWVLNNSKNKTVLNLFAHTGGFSLAAALGQASQITSIESNKNNLNWAKRNFELNNLDGNNYKFLFRDSITFLEQSRSKSSKYDLIICDTPSFFRREKGIFKIETGLEKFLENCLTCLSKNGELLFSTNFDGFFIDDVRKTVLKAQASLKITKLEVNCVLPSLDFELPDDKTNLKSFLIRLG